jgi:predicted porin
LRYDSPKFGGFGVAASWMTNNRSNGRWDVAGRYGGELGSFQVGAALAYSRPRSSSVDDQVNGSASILHTSGFNFTFAGGRQNPKASGRDNPKFFYLKGGYIAQWLSWGDTAFSVDYYKGKDIFSDGTDPSSVGFGVVQKVRDYGTEFYLGMRNYDADDPSVNGDSKRSKDNFSVLAGARVKF